MDGLSWSVQVLVYKEFLAECDILYCRDMIDYYAYTWDKMAGIDYSNMFKLCDQITLRTDAIMNIYGPTFSKVRART